MCLKKLQMFICVEYINCIINTMLSTFLTSGNLIDFLGHKGVSTYLDASIKFDKKGTTIEEFIQNVTRMQQKQIIGTKVNIKWR